MMIRRLVLAAAAIALPGLAQAQSDDPSFRLNNRGRITIQEVYVSSSQDSSWGQDRLGANVLPPGQTLAIPLPRGQCVNDIRLVFENGESAERRRVNTCQLTEINVPN